MCGKSVKRMAFRVARKASTLLLPGRRKLPFDYWLHMLEGTLGNELRFLHRIVGSGDVAIDVGANHGLYSYNLSKRFSKVYSFEINADLTRDLEAYNPGNIEIINRGLSSREGDAVLYIPLRKGQSLTGWASLTPNNCPDTREHTTKPARVSPLDKFNIERVAFIKIDVEGHEIEVIKGGANTLRRSRPVVLIEIKSHNLDEAFSLFADMEYEPRELGSFVDATAEEENYIFVPREHNATLAATREVSSSGV
jgi:FkbM family methyltransferase